jgi:hypothetical protein
MFEANSISESQNLDIKSPFPPKKSNKKTKAHSFSALTSVLQGWKPSDPLELRRYLINEVIKLLDENNYTCARACIPAIIADNQYPIDLLHYDSDQDIDEFIARMLWMHQEFNSAIGIFLGVPNEEIAAKVEEAFESLLICDDDCIILLM